MLINIYRFLLKLPNLRGKARITSLFRRFFLSPRVSNVIRGLKMELDPLEWLQIEIMTSGCTEPITSALYEKILVEGDTYIDVGAHVGFHTLIARQLIDENGYVFAIDPQPYNCQKILTNWQLNNFTNILVYIAAVGNISDKIVLNNQQATDKAKLSLCEDVSKSNGLKFQVPLLKLEEIIEENQLTNIKLIKIDVEGYELEVVEGLEKFSNRVENLIIEILETPPNFSMRTIALLDKLQSLGYKFKTANSHEWLRDTPLPENNLWAYLPTEE